MLVQPDLPSFVSVISVRMADIDSDFNWDEFIGEDIEGSDDDEGSSGGSLAQDSSVEVILVQQRRPSMTQQASMCSVLHMLSEPHMMCAHVKCASRDQCRAIYKPLEYGALLSPTLTLLQKAQRVASLQVFRVRSAAISKTHITAGPPSDRIMGDNFYSDMEEQMWMFRQRQLPLVSFH